MFEARPMCVWQNTSHRQLQTLSAGLHSRRIFSSHRTFVTVPRRKKANENRLLSKKMKSQKKGDRKSGKNVDY